MFSRKRKPTGKTAPSKSTPNLPMWPTHQSLNNNESGVGYGGSNADTQRLLAGRKRAEQACDVEDGENTKFLHDVMTQMQQWCQGTDGATGEEEEQKTKVTSILADVFRNQIPTDWNHRAKLYHAALDLTSLLSSKREFVPLLGDPDDVESVVYWLDDFGQQAEQIVKHESTTAANKARKGGGKDIKFANRVVEVRDEAVKMAKLYNGKPEEELTMFSFGERYQGELGPMRFDTVESMDNHYFLKQIPNAPTTLNTRKLFRELAAYRNALPVEYGSSAFCRVINSRLDLLRVMITGPDGSPYANGCFFFDINLPSTYPRVAPKVQFLTTGGGRIRFNPNLYNCGKVCLSLLGTWQGPGWISGESTLLQVLISIQSLILVPDPYFNEPGFEASRGTTQGNACSTRYNANIRQYTIDAAIKSHLSSILKNKNAYPEFEGVMVKHFLEKRSLIEKELKSWAEEDSRLKSQVQSVLELFDRLSAREKEARRGGSRSKHSLDSAAKRPNQPIEPIQLDDSDVEEVIPLAAAGKSEETIEIDLCDDTHDNIKETTKVYKKGGLNDIVDLT